MLEEKPLSFKEKARKLFVIIAVGVFVFTIMCFKKGLNEESGKKKLVQNKLKYFKPTIIESFWGRKIQWELRDNPLSDEEVNLIINN